MQLLHEDLMNLADQVNVKAADFTRAAPVKHFCEIH